MIGLGMVSTCMITMPQWFKFLHLNNAEIDERLALDYKEADEKLYYIGIILALVAMCIDMFTHLAIRAMGHTVPVEFVPFA